MQRPPRYALKSGLGWGLGLSLVLGGLGARPAQAQYKLPAPVPPPATGTLPAPIHSTQPQSLPSGLVPVNPPQTNAGVAPDTASNTATLTVPLLVAQWRAQKSTPQEAWDKGNLTVDDLIYVLNHSIDAWGGFYWEKDAALRREIEALLVQHGGVKLAKPETLSPAIRLWLADYYQSIGDSRAVDLAESVLANIQTPVKGENPLVFQALERIAWFYENRGDTAHAVQAWLRIVDMHADPGWWLQHAAWACQRMGDEESEWKIWGRMAQGGNIVNQELGLVEQAKILMRAGKYTEARQKLQVIKMGNIPAQAQMKLWSLVAYSYYLAGDFDMARNYLEKALAQYSTQEVGLDTPGDEVGLLYRATIDRQRLQWIKSWQQSPLVSQPQMLRVPVDGTNNLITRRVAVRSYNTLARFTVSSDTPNVKAHVEGKKQTNDYYTEQDVVLEISPTGLKRSLDATLLIGSPQFPNFAFPLPVHVDMAEPIQKSMDNIFFGFVKVRTTSAKSLKLVSTVPFRLLKVESGSDSLKTKPDSTEANREHSIEIALNPQVPGQFYQGQIKITTDLPTQEVIQIPYMAHAN